MMPVTYGSMGVPYGYRIKAYSVSRAKLCFVRNAVASR
ncbi:hypothetical protein JCM19240_5675 [Vibrio maritimus]|uniref:Uncharacterized protein n=1 Tax=Vibrio maritimus TaxID=990268 RepID=A0A090T0I4_9VIBR|nr:hypothetical protein JCM19240_5675 [Vibrio maritimus]